MRSLLHSGVAVLAMCLAGAPVLAQNDRRDRRDPELILESGGRMGACDQLAFTKDGRYLLAAGDDKVVRLWPCAGGQLDARGMRVLRWSVWREQRGAIYALAVSPDQGGGRVAIGGLGAKSSTVAVLDRVSGRVLHSVTPEAKPGEDHHAVMALAFAPSGQRIAYGTGDGSVWLWDFRSNRRLGAHPARGEFNRIRLVHFLAEQRLLSVAEDGTVARWDLNSSPPTRTALPRLQVENYSLHRVAISSDGRWLAGAAKGPAIALRSLDGRQRNNILLDKGQFPRSIAFDPRGSRLAVGIGSVMARAKFYLEADDRIRFYDLSRQPLAATEGPHHSYRAEFLAFHPDGGRLAVAGGDNHEVTLWDLPPLTPNPAPPKGGEGRVRGASVMRGSGSGLWGVALSEDGRYLSFQDRRDATSLDPNRRGRGDGCVFDLPGRQWVSVAEFRPARNLTQSGRWHVEPSASDPYVWYAVDGDGQKHKLPLDRDRDGMPRCWIFLPAGRDQPVRLAVGHYWGLSVFALSEQGVRRVRLCTGHQGEVTSLAATADGTWLVSASSDQTIAAWSLDGGKLDGASLGARFAVKGKRLQVEAVEVGSAAWEAGLVEGDEVVLFAFAGREVMGGAEAWLKRLGQPEPGKEHYFRVERDGRRLDLLTTMRQRPLWRFFPMRDGEWVLWMWRNSYYDTSTKGDFAIGWHVNSPDLSREPAFYRAEQFRKVFERPDILDKLLQTRDVRAALRLVSDNPVPLRFDRMEPPAVRLELSEAKPEEDVPATVSATPHGDNPDHQPRRAELWINDYRLAVWDDVLSWDKSGAMYRRKIDIPNKRLRAGRNVLTFQTYNRLGGRSETTAVLTCRRAAPAPRLLGLSVGINDYSAVKPAPGGKRSLGNLENACDDARAIRQRWTAQKLYAAGDMFLHLDTKAGRAEILAALDELAKRAGPDDRCLLFLAGHGVFLPQRAAEGPPRSSFVFCCPHYDPARPSETGLTSQVLYEKLAAIPCRKIVLLDACHAGEAAANPVRELTPGGQGPIVLAACDRNQESHENKELGHGLFTYAILEALGDRFAAADRNGDALLDVAELFAYTRSRMPLLLRQMDLKEHAQVPILFAPGEENYPLARKP